MSTEARVVFQILVPETGPDIGGNVSNLSLLSTDVLKRVYHKWFSSTSNDPERKR